MEGFTLRGRTTDKAVEVTNEGGEIIVTPKAVGKATVTISLYEGNEEVAGSGKPFVFTAKDNTPYLSYRVEPVADLYDTQGAKEEINKKYGQELIVAGMTTEVVGEQLKSDAFELVEEKSSNLKLEDGKLYLNESKLIYDGQSAELPFVVRIKSTGETIEQVVRVTKVKPKVVELKANNPSIEFSKATDDDKALDWEWLLNNVGFTAKDQYGVEVNSDDLKKIASKATQDEEEEDEDDNSNPGSTGLSIFEFPDGTEIKSTIQFKKESGSLLFENDGTYQAKVTDYSKDAKVKAIVTAGGVSTEVIVTMKDKHTPELDKVVEGFNRKLCKEESCEGKNDIKVSLNKDIKNIVEELKEYIKHKDYDIKISLVNQFEHEEQVVIEENGDVHHVECSPGSDCDGTEDVKATVIYTISHKTETEFEKKDEEQEIIFEVPKATEVILTRDSLGTADSHKITKLTENHRYVVRSGVTDKYKYHAVTASGKLSEGTDDFDKASEEADFLKGKEITGLFNGETYKVKKAKLKLVTGVTATLVDHDTVRLDFPAIAHAETVTVQKCKGDCENENSWSEIEEDSKTEITSSSTEVNITNLDLDPDKKYYFRLVIDEKVKESDRIYEKYSEKTTEEIMISTVGVDVVKEILDKIEVPQADNQPTTKSSLAGDYESDGVEEVEIEWSSKGENGEEVTESFQAGQTYIAEIKLELSLGYTLKGLTAGDLELDDVKDIQISIDDNNITVEYPKIPDNENGSTGSDNDDSINNDGEEEA